MSEETTTESTQPNKPAKKRLRINWKSFLTSTVGVLVILSLGILGGYNSGIGMREDAKATLVSQQLTEQFALALIDIDNGRYEAAKQRLDFIILNDPTFPGATQKMAEVLVLMSIPTATPTPTLTPTPDLRGAEALFTQAQQLIAAQDWANALVALDQLRKDDPTYHTAEVDGMYYFALRNEGHYLITQQGNLEGGIYYLTLAERFAPLDNTANGLREGARLYILAASFWEVDWEQAVVYFSQLAGGWPSLWDGTMTAGQRYYQALMRYGDQLVEQQRYCAAYDQYVAAQAYGELDEIAAKNKNKAFQICYPPTETPVPTDVVVGDTPIVDNTPIP
ncbi:MAG: hypothetical protein ACOYZ8_18665 [Chloroflexota bacterium]